MIKSLCTGLKDLLKYPLGGDGMEELWWHHTELIDDLNSMSLWKVRALWKWMKRFMEEILAMIIPAALCVCVRSNKSVCACVCVRERERKSYIQAGSVRSLVWGRYKQAPLCCESRCSSRAQSGSSKSRSLPPSSSSVSTSPAPPRSLSMAAANGLSFRSTGDTPLVKGKQPDQETENITA